MRATDMLLRLGYPALKMNLDIPTGARGVTDTRMKSTIAYLPHLSQRTHPAQNQ
jgi:hypothetical protein